MKLKFCMITILGSLISSQSLAAEGVARSTFTTAIDNREPVNEISQLSPDESKIYYFTEIKGLKDQTISHRWEQNGEVQATVDFNIGGDRWRVWSSKNLQPEFTGEWQVMVVDQAGNVLAQNSFNYGNAINSINNASEIQADAEENTEIESGTQNISETQEKILDQVGSAETEVTENLESDTEQSAVQ